MVVFEFDVCSENVDPCLFLWMQTGGPFRFASDLIVIGQDPGGVLIGSIEVGPNGMPPDGLRRFTGVSTMFPETVGWHFDTRNLGLNDLLLQSSLRSQLVNESRHKSGWSRWSLVTSLFKGAPAFCKTGKKLQRVHDATRLKCSAKMDMHTHISLHIYGRDIIIDHEGVKEMNKKNILCTYVLSFDSFYNLYIDLLDMS